MRRLASKVCTSERCESKSPNELLFGTHTHAHTHHVRNYERFTETDFNDRGDEHGGISWERDPIRHRKVAKQLSPAFSPRSIAAKPEPTFHKYFDIASAKQLSLAGLTTVSTSLTGRIGKCSTCPQPSRTTVQPSDDADKKQQAHHGRAKRP
ncbi:hypothetical protein F4780DRAFT_630787 [Xylariomycetidae sp. FL0641]|nr:hypothetical protein F4780DRAFT_630787 [Xylariomycetidae sp. FL0641]